MNFRLLTPNEIEIRVGSAKDTGLSLLLYKDARVDQNLLDETVGSENWQRDHKELKNVIYCGIGIYNKEISQWVWKWDAGSESNADKEKGEASDSFKRAGFNWGIGRELYSSPFIWVGSGKFKDKYDKFEVIEIGYDDKREINKLKIKNITLDKIIFEMGKQIEHFNIDKVEYATTEQIAELKTLVADLDAVAKYLKKDNINALTKVEIQNIIDKKKKAN